MNVRIQTFLTNTKDKWASLDKQQKTKISIATVLILVTFIFAMYMLLKPKMVKLVAHEDVVTISNYKLALEAENIATKDADDGTSLLVNEKDKVRANVILATQSGINGNTDKFVFEDALNLMGMGTTENVKKETLIRAKQGEIEGDLEAFNSVQSASVQLAMPEDDQFFLEDTDPVTAAVKLSLTDPIDIHQAQAIASYVASSVVGLDIENVRVIDSNMNELYSGDMESGVNRQFDIEAQKKAEIEESVVEQLKPLYSDIKVTSTIKFDWNNSVIDSTTYEAPNPETPTVGIINKEQSTQENVQGGTSGAAPGTPTNGGTTIYGNTNEGESASGKSSAKDYSINETRTTTEKTGGTIDYNNSSLSVMVYNYVFYNQSTMEASGELGTLTWDQFKQQTLPTAMEVAPEIVTSVVTGTGISNVSVTGQQVPIFIDKVETPPQVKEIVMFVVLGILILLLALLIIRNTQTEEVEEVEPELSVEDLLVSTKVEEIQEVQEAEAIKIKQENTIKTQIDKFVTERPDAAAQLLRNWLNEDWE